jgi:CrcB protein
MEPVNPSASEAVKADPRRLSDDGGPAVSGTGGKAVDADPGTLGVAPVRHPLHLHPGFVLIVILGGTVGALARYGLSTVLPSPGGWPLPTLIINLTGALLLGALLEALVRQGPDAGRLRIIRLLAGTGFMGAFTTYSTLALETNLLLGRGRPTDALVYVAVTLLAGALATVVGIRVAAGLHGGRTSRSGRAPSTKPGGGR